MARFTEQELAKAFVVKPTLSFADVIEKLERRSDLKPDRKRDMISGLRRVAGAIGWSLEDTPADPVWLRPKIARVKPAAHGIKQKTWTNAVSNARSALVETGIVERDRGSPIALSSKWRALWDAALATGDKNITIPLSRFTRFCSNMGISSKDVSDEVVAAFQRALELSKIRKDPASATWQAIHAWNLAIERVSGWPLIRLTKPQRHNHYAIPLAEFPAKFRDELEAVTCSLAKPVRRLGAKRHQSLSPSTIDSRHRHWIRFASAVVHSGTPVDELTTLSDLLCMDRVEAAIEWLAENRYGGQTSRGLQEMALGLCTLGRELEIDEAQLEQFRELSRVLSGRPDNRHMRKKGLTAKNRERLRQFRNPATRDALLCPPSVLMEEARKVNHPVKAARLAEVALAIAIETVAPIRLKNSAPLEFQLPDRIRRILETFVADFRPHLIAQPCPWLFAREDGTDQVHQTVLARRITETVSERLGLEMNVHLFRHLAAMLILEQDPAAFDLVRRILGHAELSTTIDAYGGLESLTATRILSDLVDKAEAEHPSRPLGRRKARKWDAASRSRPGPPEIKQPGRPCVSLAACYGAAVPLPVCARRPSGATNKATGTGWHSVMRKGSSSTQAIRSSGLRTI